MARTDPELTDAQWAALEPLLPPQRPATGRPNNDHRQVVEAMVWLARTGRPGATCLWTIREFARGLITESDTLTSEF